MYVLSGFFSGFFFVASSNTLLNLSTINQKWEPEDHKMLSEFIKTPQSKLNQPGKFRENEELAYSDVDIDAYIIMHEKQIDQNEASLKIRLGEMIEQRSENEDDGFRKEFDVCTIVYNYYAFIFYSLAS